jgi:arylsulfatase
VVSWPNGIAARGEVREQYVHAVDVVPTLYDLLGIDPPAVIKGYPQTPIEGISFRPTFTDATAPGKTTQFYSMLGQRALYHDGWLANTRHPPISGWSNFDRDVWELYHLAEDRAQCHDLAATEPERLEQLKQLWSYYAGIYNGLPLDDRSALEILSTWRPEPGEPRNRYVYYPDTAEVPESVAVNIRRRSFTIAAATVLDAADAEGALFSQGAMAGGHSLFLQGGRLHYVYNWLGERVQKVSADRDISTGRHVFSAEFQKTGDDPETKSATGTLTLFVDGDEVGRGDIWTQPGPFGLAGTGVSVGRDSGSPVTADYRAPFRFRGGTIERVVVDVSGDPYLDHEKEVLAWLARD